MKRIAKAQGGLKRSLEHAAPSSVGLFVGGTCRVARDCGEWGQIVESLGCQSREFRVYLMCSVELINVCVCFSPVKNVQDIVLLPHLICVYVTVYLVWRASGLPQG